jgi:hypothetical protein
LDNSSPAFEALEGLASAGPANMTVVAIAPMKVAITTRISDILLIKLCGIQTRIVVDFCPIAFQRFAVSGRDIANARYLKAA